LSFRRPLRVAGKRNLRCEDTFRANRDVLRVPTVRQTRDDPRHPAGGPQDRRCQAVCPLSYLLAQQVHPVAACPHLPSTLIRSMKNLTDPARLWTRWPLCSVNHCPLDPEQDHRWGMASDKQRHCTMARTVRARIGARFPDILPFRGLKPRESLGLARQSALSPEAKAARDARFAALRPVAWILRRMPPQTSQGATLAATARKDQ
jgi:hypothetical protein